MESVADQGKRMEKLQTLGSGDVRGEWLRRSLQDVLSSLGERRPFFGAVDIVYEHEGKYFVGDASVKDLPQHTFHYCLDDQRWYALDCEGRLARLEDTMGKL